MRPIQLTIVTLFIFFTFSSCKKEATGAEYVSESGNLKIEVTGTHIPFDPWLVTVSVIYNQKPLYEISQIEVYASEIDSSTVSFDWSKGACTINIEQMDGSIFPIPIMKLPTE